MNIKELNTEVDFQPVGFVSAPFVFRHIIQNQRDEEHEQANNCLF